MESGGTLLTIAAPCAPTRLGHYWKADVGHFSKAPKAIVSEAQEIVKHALGEI